jgi:hypothetical protein
MRDPTRSVLAEVETADGGPAFPRPSVYDHATAVAERSNGIIECGQDGMSLMDFFATVAMHAELVTAGVPGEAADAFIEGKMREGHTVEQHLAFNAYNVAEAMVAERKRRAAKQSSGGGTHG